MYHLYGSHTYSFSMWLGWVLRRNCCVIPALISIEMFSDARGPPWTFWNLLHLLSIRAGSVFMPVCEMEVSVA